MDITEKPEGCIISIRARPGGKKNSIGDLHDGALKIEVTAAPEKGKANKAIIKLLAKFLKIPASSIILVSGETNRDKKLLLKNIDKQYMTEKFMLLKKGDA